MADAEREDGSMPEMDRRTETIVSPEKRAETEHVSGMRQHIHWDGDASGPTAEEDASGRRWRKRKPVAGCGRGGCK